MGSVISEGCSGLGEGFLVVRDGWPGAAYPSHFRPVEVHRLQKGFPSSHLTLRILKAISVTQVKNK